MQGMEKTIPELFAMLKVAEVQIKKEHQVLMVNKTTIFKKKGKGKNKGNFKKTDKQVVTPGKKPKSGPKSETQCFYYKGTGHYKRNCPKYLADKKDGKVNKGIFDIMLLMCTLLILIVVPGYLIPVRLLIFVTRNRDYRLNQDWLRTR